MASPKVVVVTGTNSGIGFEIIGKLLASKTPYVVYCGARSLDKAQDAVKKATSGVGSSQTRLIPIVIDIDADQSILNAVKDIEKEQDHVDILINNAGVNLDASRDQQDFLGAREKLNAMWNTNIAGTYQLTFALAPLLLKSKDPRIIFVSSDVSSFGRDGDANYPLSHKHPAGWPKDLGNEYPGYRASKSALNMVMRHWARWLEADGVKVWAVCPGLVATNLGGVGVETLKSWGAGSPEDSAKFIVGVAEGQRDADVGTGATPAPTAEASFGRHIYAHWQLVKEHHGGAYHTDFAPA